MSSSDKKQETLDFEPEYLESYGIKHEFTGTLFIPTQDEFKRIEREQAERETSPVVFAEPVLYIKQDVPRQRIKMKPTDALKLRAR